MVGSVHKKPCLNTQDCKSTGRMSCSHLPTQLSCKCNWLAFPNDKVQQWKSVHYCSQKTAVVQNQCMSRVRQTDQNRHTRCRRVWLGRVHLVHNQLKWRQLKNISLVYRQFIWGSDRDANGAIDAIIQSHLTVINWIFITNSRKRATRKESRLLPGQATKAMCFFLEKQWELHSYCFKFFAAEKCSGLPAARHHKDTHTLIWFIQYISRN